MTMIKTGSFGYLISGDILIEGDKQYVFSFTHWELTDNTLVVSEFIENVLCDHKIPVHHRHSDILSRVESVCDNHTHRSLCMP
jgi:hypothetical protein